MYTGIPIWLSCVFIVAGLVALAWSSDRFVVGAAALAKRLGISEFVVGMVVVGFGTSAPELLVSTFSGLGGHTNLSIGNAYGSCVFNIIGILGVAALIRPLIVKPSISFVAVPLLTAITALSWFLLRDGVLARTDALALLAIFAIVMPLYCRYDKSGGDEGDAGETPSTLAAAIAWTLIGLGVMVGASHILVWGAVDIARALGVGELLIGLTIVAIGTSIPELASAIAAARRDKAELVLGNIIGSNLFNMLAVVGIAGSISPSSGFSRFVTLRDLPFLALATLSIAIFGLNRKNPRESGRVSRLQGFIWVVALAAYMALMLYHELGK